MKCQAMTSDGSPCQQFAMKGSQFCYAHHPRNAEARERSTSKANRAQKSGRLTVDPSELPVQSLETLADVTALSRWVPIAVVTGRIDARTGDVAQKALKEARTNLERERDDTHREQIAELRETLAEIKAGRGGGS